MDRWIIEDGYLIHHGIKGQKWGVRRFQNKDGSLTSTGKKRYKDSKSDSAEIKQPRTFGRFTEAVPEKNYEAFNWGIEDFTVLNEKGTKAVNDTISFHNSWLRGRAKCTKLDFESIVPSDNSMSDAIYKKLPGALSYSVRDDGSISYTVKPGGPGSHDPAISIEIKPDGDYFIDFEEWD